MKKCILCGLGILIACNISFSQLVSDTFLVSYTMQQVDSVYTANGIPTFAGEVNYPVDAYKVIYQTPDASGDTTIASGALFMPQNVPCGAPIISYQHGTISNNSNVPSNMGGEFIIGLIAAAHGYVVCMPDYLGMGDGSGFHPYSHAATEASAVLDMIRAGKTFCSNSGTPLNDQLFLMGYSQGGHATMASIREIELYYPTEFNVVATVPMAGPYDMSGVQRELLESDSVYSQPGYLPYIMLGYNEVYGLFDSIQQVLKPPYDSLVEVLFDGNYGMGTINSYMLDVPKLMIDSAYYANYDADSLHPFKEALRDNDLYDWVPQTYIMMIHCSGDEVVPFEHAQIAYDAFIAAGSDSVVLVDGGPLGHSDCAENAIIGAKLYIDSRAQFCDSSAVVYQEPGFADLKVFPNPNTGIFNVYAGEHENGTIVVLDILGRQTLSLSLSGATMYTLDLTERGAGIYYVVVTGETGAAFTSRVVVR